MRLLRMFLAAVVTAVSVSACGGGGSGGDGVGASDRYAAEGFSSAEEGEKACKEESPGLRAGDHTIQNVEIPTARRWQRWRSKPGGDRSYDLVKGGAMGWEIDGFAVRFRGAIDDSFPYRDAYEINGEPVTIDAPS